MITITYAQLMNDNFALSFQRLSRAPLQIKVAYNVKKVADELQIAKKRVTEEYNQELKTVLPAEGEKIEGDPKDLQAKIAIIQDAFGQRVARIEREKIDIHSLTNVELSVVDLTNLDPVLFDSAEVKVEDQVEPKKPRRARKS